MVYLLSHLHAYPLGSAVCSQGWDSRIFQALLLFLLDLLIGETKDWGGEKEGICLPFFLPISPCGNTLQLALASSFLQNPQLRLHCTPLDTPEHWGWSACYLPHTQATPAPVSSP